MAIVISDAIRAKLLAKHDVTEKEVREAFTNQDGPILEDDREDHRTDPPTRWFLAPTNKNRLLKICYVRRDSDVFIRTAYPPNETEIEIYDGAR